MPLNTYRMRGQEIYELTLFYIDNSFSYRDCYGGTVEDLEPAGFSFSLDKDNVIIPDTFHPFGYFDEDQKSYSNAEIYAFLSDLIKDIMAGVCKDAKNDEEDIECWLPMLKELKDGCFNRLSIKSVKSASKAA